MVSQGTELRLDYDHIHEILIVTVNRTSGDDAVREQVTLNPLHQQQLYKIMHDLIGHS